MPYSVFCEKCKRIARKAGMKVRFQHDDETKKHIARFTDGTIITGNESQLKVTVRWNGKNHQAVVAL